MPNKITVRLVYFLIKETGGAIRLRLFFLGNRFG